MLRLGLKLGIWVASAAASAASLASHLLAENGDILTSEAGDRFITEA